MTDVAITVRGTHSVALPPQQATVYATVSADGPVAEPVLALVAATVAAITASLQARHDSAGGPVTRYAVEQVRKGAHRPYNQDGRQLPLVYTASASVSATFTDFDDLAGWIGQTAGMDGAGINHIEWALSDDHRLTVERETRQEAVRDARRRAQDYADALGLGPVAVRTISDPGLSGPVHAKVVMARAMAAPAGGPAEITLRPEDVQIESQVEATFVVPGGS
jgi:uncharacterized protein YggE